MGKFDGSDDLTIFNSQKILLGTGLHFLMMEKLLLMIHILQLIYKIFFLIYILMNILKIMLIVYIKLIKAQN